MEFEEVEVLAIPHRGEYRQTIKDFIKSNFKKAKINVVFRARAKYVATRLRGWIASDESVKIVQDKHIIYLIRSDIDEV